MEAGKVSVLMTRPLNKSVSLGGWSNVIPNWGNDYRAGQPGVGFDQTAPDGPLDPATQKLTELDWNMADELEALGVTHVKFWVSWYQLAQNINQPRLVDPLDPVVQAYPERKYALGRAPQTFEEQAQFMEASRGVSVRTSEPLINYLDRSIALANQRGLKVILAMYQEAPTWAAPATSATPPEGRIVEQRFPATLNADSPYGWFIRYLIARYTGHVTGGPGCGCIPARGNPLGAKIQFIEPLNEPNYEWWPQDATGDSQLSYCKAAEAMTTCEWWARLYAPDYSPGFNPADPNADWDGVLTVLGPSTSDANSSTDSNGRTVVTGYEGFTDSVLNSLSEWGPVMRVGWAHHNYRDVEKRRDLVDAHATRVAALLSDWDFLKNSPHLPLAWRRELWLTEGAYRIGREQDVPDPDDDTGATFLPAYGAMPDLVDSEPLENQERYKWQAVQSDAIRHNFLMMRDALPAVLWTQHVIYEEDDIGNVYGLREKMRHGFDSQGNQYGPHGPGRKRLSWSTFADLDP